MFKRLFGAEGDPTVGPCLQDLYAQLDSQQKESFRKTISRAPSGGELVAYSNVLSAEVASAMEQMPKQWLRELSLAKQAVAGAERLAQGYAFYVKGNISLSQLDTITAYISQYQSEVNMRAPAGMQLEIDIQSGCYADDQLSPLVPG